MTDTLVKYLGKPVSELLESPPFKFWAFERSVDEDLPDRIINYTSDQQSFHLICDNDEKIQTIFLTADHFDETRFCIPFSLRRREALSLLGVPSKSGDAHTDPILGEYGPWDRFDCAGHSIHIEYQPHADRIKMVTLMRADVVP